MQTIQILGGRKEKDPPRRRAEVLCKLTSAKVKGRSVKLRMLEG